MDTSSQDGPFIATIDFETRSTEEIGRVGAFKYAAHPKTEILCLAYKLPGSPLNIWAPEYNLPIPLLNWAKAGRIIEAHNAEFEYAVWNYLCSKRYGFPILRIEQMRCSAAKAAALALPRSLEALGAALSLPIQKDMTGRRLMLKMSKPRKETKNDFSLWHETKEEKEKLFEYCKRDVETEELASREMMELLPSELDLFHLTMKINERGILCDTELCKTAVSFAEKHEKRLLAEFGELTGGKVKTVKQTAKLQEFLSGIGCAIPNLQAMSVEIALKEEIPPLARKILSIRQALSKSSIKKYQSMIAMSGEDNRIRGTLLFNGASTGRFSGRGIQPQNFSRPKFKDVGNIIAALRMGDFDFFESLYPDVFTALSSALRGMLKAPEGSEFISGDYNAIEARGVLWLAGDDDGLEIFRAGRDIYKEMASLIFKKPIQEITPHERFIGKETVLGCGFGMGFEKFKLTLKTKWNVEISEELAKKAVYAYREKHFSVKELWGDLERASIAAVRSSGKVMKLRNLQFLCKNKFLQIQLPSGRRLSYFEPRVKVESTKFGLKEVLSFLAVDSQTKQWRKESTYGGKLTENIVQAIARDIMVHAMKKLEEKGYPIILTVHDEIVSEIIKGKGSLVEFLKIMSEVPNWAHGFPVKVEGWNDERYRK